MPPGSSRWRPKSVLWLLAAALVIGPSCKPRSTDGTLTPPSDAAEWESKWRPAFDDDYTAEPINLEGRAPHDVRDQRLLALRMGHADLMARVRVLQVWGRGRYQGQQDQYVEVEIEEYLINQPIKGTAERQIVKVISEDELPGSLQGRSLVMFLRWAPGDQPPYHHHLMPMDEATIGFMVARIEHAKAEGVLDAEGVPTEKQGGKRGKKKAAGDGEAEAKPEEGAGDEADAGGAEPEAVEPAPKPTSTPPPAETDDGAVPPPPPPA